MSGKNANAKLQDRLAAMMDQAVADEPPVVAKAAETPSPTAPPARAARAARKPAAVKRSAAVVTASAPIAATVSLYGPAADALRKLQAALLMAAGKNVSASAAVSVALQYAAGQLPGETAQLVELLAALAQHDKRRRQS